MFSRTFHLPAFLRRVFGSEPFLDYCRERALPTPTGGGTPTDAGLRRWSASFLRLPGEAQTRVEMEFAEVNELAGRDGNAFLLAAAGDAGPPALGVPAGGPLALWFFVHREPLFREVLLHHEVREARAWRRAQAAPGVEIADLPRAQDALADALRRFFGLDAGRGRFCAVEAHRLSDVYCFTAYVADRMRLVETFTDAGRLARTRLRPASTVAVTYQPDTGEVRLQTSLRSRDRVLALLGVCCQAVLGRPVPVPPPIVLERLKHPFRPLPDAQDMAMIRVKCLHLRYPARRARRQVKLETHASDAPTAMDELLAAHAGSGLPLEEVRVAYAELLVRLRVHGGNRNYLIRLWPDRTSLNSTPLHTRFRRCLRTWGLTHDA